MLIKRSQYPILIFNVIALIVFTYMFLQRTNFEFLIYVSVIIFFLALIILTNPFVNYPNPLLWGLTLWAFMHMAGGAILIDGQVLYKQMIINLIGEPYLVLKYDQVVHAIGFGVATFAMYYVIKPHLKVNKNWIAVLIVVALAGAGFGTLNEIVEFIATVLIPETNVGGYVNTALDLIANLVGAIVASIGIYFIERKKKITSS